MLSIVAVEGLPEIRRGDDLAALIAAALSSSRLAVEDGDVRSGWLDRHDGAIVLTVRAEGDGVAALYALFGDQPGQPTR